MNQKRDIWSSVCIARREITSLEPVCQSKHVCHHKQTSLVFFVVLDVFSLSTQIYNLYQEYTDYRLHYFANIQSCKTPAIYV